MKRFYLIVAAVVMVALSIAVFPGNVMAQEPGTLGTGLNPPTPEQSEWMRQNFPVIQTLHLNSLAVERINAYRQEKGQSRLTAAQLKAAPMGREAEFASNSITLGSTSGGSAGQTSAAVFSALPESVDNSLNAAFPPVRSQGSIGSCVAWSTTYYQLTYETNLALGRTAKNGDNNMIFSPKWTYNMINGGVDGGAYFSDAYNLELKNGAATYADFPYDTNYRAWDLNPSHWNTAINSRTLNSGSIYNSNTDTMIDNIKTQITNGHIMVIGTYVSSWVKTQLKNDPATAGDDAFAGQYIASYQKNTNQGGHGMTVVGYNDTLWCDLNGNSVVDTGEKGAFKIANSWGTGDWNAGYRWITYDSLRRVSAVPAYGAWPTTDRASGGLMFSGTVYTITVSPSAYAPAMKAEITLNSAKRSQVRVTLGLGSAAASTPAYTWTSKAIYATGGSYAFNGTTTAVDGTFWFDFSDLTKYASGTNRWFVGIADSTAGDATTIKSFNLYQGNTLVASASGLPKTVDAAQAYVWANYAYNSVSQLPTAVISAAPTSGTAPLTVSFSGSGSTAPSGSIESYSWAFGDGSTATGVSANHIYTAAGQYTATLTVTDNLGKSGSATKVITVTAPVPPTAVISATPASGAIPLTVSFSGSGSTAPSGSIVSYSWAFGDGSTASGVSATHTYTAVGQYTATLTVTDNGGLNGSATKAITVSVPPAAVISASPTSGTAPLTVKFSGSGSTAPFGTIVSYSWSFGDGSTSSGVSVSHIYTSVGQFTAILKVTDNLGLTASASQAISVALAPPNAPSRVTTSVNKNKVALSWNDNSNCETGYYVERGTKVNNVITYTRIATITSTVYNETLPAGTYYYRVQAYNAAGVSAYSPVVSARVK